MILVNKQPVAWQENLTLDALKQAHCPTADVATINGFPAAGSWKDVNISDGDTIVLMEKAAALGRDEFERITAENITPAVFYELKEAAVGIAGLGGLGSAVAIALARIGTGKLIIADFDVVEPANLNRQQYTVEQIGRFKTDATTENIRRVNPYITINAHRVRLTPENIPRIFAGADVIAECLDRAEQKQIFTETVFSKLPDTVLVSVSGLAGYGNSNAIRTRHVFGRHILVGDGESAARPGRGLVAPRVGIAAHHQANAVVEVLVNRRTTQSSERKKWQR